MSNRLVWRVGPIAVLCLALIIGSFISFVHAENTGSIQLQRSSGQYLSISDAAQTGLDLASGLTFESWIKLSSLPSPGQTYVILSKREGATDNRQYSWSITNVSGTYKLMLVLSDTGNNVDYAGQITWPAPTTGTWYHVAASWSALSQTYTAYVNGNVIDTDDTTASMHTSVLHNGTGSFKIGAEEATPTNFFDGLLDDVRVWAVERTGTQINSDKSNELLGNESYLVGYWKFNNSLTDSTSYGNTLTANNGASLENEAAFAGFVETLFGYRTGDLTRNSSATPTDDPLLKLTLASNKTYILDGVLIVSSTSAAPDMLASLSAPSGTTAIVGYVTNDSDGVMGVGVVSDRITITANSPTSIHIKGTIKTGNTPGEVHLQWAQATSNSHDTAMMAGSYLHAEAI